MLDSSGYLKSYNWKEGEALQKGGIKKPILVKHKKDKKGIGHQVSGAADAWWERLFDGQLKGLDVQQDTNGNGLSFKQDEVVIASAVPVNQSPLYRMFVRGETLQATTGKVILRKSTIETKIVDITQLKTSFDSGEMESEKKRKKTHKKEKSETTEKENKKEKKEKKDKVKEKKDKGKERKGKKERKEKISVGKKDGTSKEKKEKIEKVSKESSKKRKSADNDSDLKRRKKSKSSK